MLRLVSYYLKRSRRDSVDSTQLVNLAMMALSQTGLTVATILGSSLICTFHERFGLQYEFLSANRFLVDYGVLGLLIPLVWVGVSVWYVQQREFDSTVHVAIHSSGWLLIAGWVLVALIVVVIPLIKGQGCSFDGS